MLIVLHKGVFLSFLYGLLLAGIFRAVMDYSTAIYLVVFICLFRLEGNFILNVFTRGEK